MRTKTNPVWLALISAVMLSGSASALTDAERMKTAQVPPYQRSVIAPPPKTLGLSAFYQKYANADGIPVIGSPKVPDAAILIARDIVHNMLSKRPDIRSQLIREGTRVGIMAIDETTTDLPEQSDWKKPAIDDPRLSKCDVRDYAKTIGLQTDRDYWAGRARGMGGTFTTGAAENIMGVPGTRYYGENILIHEFSHGILGAIQTVDPALYKRVEAAYANAKAKRLWQGAYMILTIDEYWAEGTQFWFNSNKAYITDALTVVNAPEFKARDPQLYAVLSEVYSSHHIKADAYYMHPARMNSARIRLDETGKAKDDCFS